MEIPWRTDIDAALADAAQQKKPVYLDFSAAPA
jgi:TPP-dependent 2-oxoacid decarboxylase